MANYRPYTFLDLDPSVHTAEDAHAIVLPVPYEASVSYIPGTSQGPEAILRASAEMEDYDPELQTEPQAKGIHTGSTLEIADLPHHQVIDAIRTAVTHYAERDKLVGLLGGEHSISAGAVQALARLYPDLSVLVFDAQADLRDSYQDSPNSHACASRRMLEHAPVTQVGVRSMTAEEAETAKRLGVSQFQRTDEPITQIEEIAQTLSTHVYISFDLDALDPSIMSAVGTPEPGGMQWWEALKIIRFVARRCRLVGFDGVELAPQQGPERSAYTAAKLAYKMIGYAGLSL